MHLWESIASRRITLRCGYIPPIRARRYSLEEQLEYPLERGRILHLVRFIVGIEQSTDDIVANTNPPHPRPPPQIYIPNFSIGPAGVHGGFAGGKNASDAPLWLSVFEEYGTGSVRVQCLVG